MQAEHAEMNPDARAFLDGLVERNTPGWHQMSPILARQVFASLVDLFGRGPAIDSIKDRSVGGVPCRVYTPADAAGTLVYFHGGGWVLGNLNSHDTMCRRLADSSGSTVVSVDYRRPPEHPFPEPLDDCVAVTRAVLEETNEPVVIGGDSAGGNLAAGVVSSGVEGLAGVVMLYPVIDPTMTTASYRTFADGHGLTSATMAWFWNHYLGGHSQDDPRLAPLQADLSSFPPALVTTSGYDVLRDEGRVFAARLKDAGRCVDHVEHGDQIHGFMHFAGVIPAGAEALVNVGQWVRKVITDAH